MKFTKTVFVLLMMMLIAGISAVSAATITVNTTTDEQNTNGLCSLREAIINANSDNQSGSADCVAGSGNDTINFSVIGTITLTGGSLPTLTTDIIVMGPGASSLTISGNNSARVMRVSSSAYVQLFHLTISNGFVSGTGGGGIYNQGLLIIYNCVISNNSDYSGAGGGIFNDGGGGLTVNNSTISGNSAPYGGGIYNGYNLVISNSTISGNQALNYGAGIFTQPGSTNSIENCTIADNQNLSSGAGAGIFGNGYSAHNIRNTILSNNWNDYTSYNCYQVNNSLGYNISSDGNCYNFTQTGDMQNTDPLLGLLQDNGGPTFTHALLEGSPAIDAGDPSNSPETDQRGTSRPQGSGPDIGAVEEQTEPLPDLTGSWEEQVAEKCKEKKEGLVCKIKGKLIITNIGEADAHNVHLRIYLSDDDSYDEGDILLEENNKGDVVVGKTYRKSLKLTLPVGMTLADGYIIAYIDADNTTTESNESNNFVVYGEEE